MLTMVMLIIMKRNLMAGYSMNIAGVDVDLELQHYSYGASGDQENEIAIGISASGVLYHLC